MNSIVYLQKLGNYALGLKRAGRYSYTFMDEKEACVQLLRHASKNVPYYTRILSESGVVHKEIVNLKYFTEIPILTKDILKKQLCDLTSSDIAQRTWRYNFSGGSTGVPTKYIHDSIYEGYKERVFHQFYQRILGINYMKARKLILWGSQRDILQKKETLRNRFVTWMENKIVLNCFKITVKDLEEYVRVNNSFRPDIVQAYATAIYELAKFIINRGIKVHSPRVIISQAENLTSEMREVITKAFMCPVRNFYGSREVSAIAGEGEDNLMHVFSFWNHIEILDENNRPAREGEEGNVVVTNLYNYAMPIIRYAIGDYAITGPMSDRYGYHHPTLLKIQGRSTEKFVKRDGTIVPPEFFIHFIGVVFNAGNIKKYQVVQEDFERIRIRLVVDGKLPASLTQKIEESICRVMGTNCTVIWEEVNDIPKTPEGKFLYTYSLVKRN